MGERSDIERAAAHFGISEREVTLEHLTILPKRGAAGTAAISEAESADWWSAFAIGTAVAAFGGWAMAAYYRRKAR